MDGVTIDFAKLLPAFMRSQTDDVAMADALTPLLKARALQLDSIGLAGFLLDPDSGLSDSQASALMDDFAGFLGLVWWRPDWTVSVKREMLGMAEQLREASESKWALQTILRAYFGDNSLTVEEWFEYGGQPYCFRVITSDASVQHQLKFRDVIELVKRQSQELEGVWIGFSLRGTVYHGERGADCRIDDCAAIAYRYLPSGTVVDPDLGLTTLQEIMEAACPGQDAAAVIADCWDSGNSVFSKDLPLTFVDDANEADGYRAIPSTHRVGERLDTALASSWADVSATITNPAVSYSWPPSP